MFKREKAKPLRNKGNRMGTILKLEMNLEKKRLIDIWPNNNNNNKAFNLK
jgi:hypothetical protein